MKKMILALGLLMSLNSFAENSLGASALGSYSSSADICGDPYGCKEILKAAKQEAIFARAGLLEETSDLLESAIQLVRDASAKKGQSLTDEEIIEILANLK